MTIPRDSTSCCGGVPRRPRGSRLASSLLRREIPPLLAEDPNGNRKREVSARSGERAHLLFVLVPRKLRLSSGGSEDLLRVSVAAEDLFSHSRRWLTVRVGAASSAEKLTVERGSSQYITPPPPVLPACLYLSLPLSRVLPVALSFPLLRSLPPPPQREPPRERLSATSTARVPRQCRMHFHPRRRARSTG